MRGTATAKRYGAGGIGGRSRAAAPASHPDDLDRVHSRRAAASVCQRRRLGRTAFGGDDGLWGNDCFNFPESVYHSDSLHRGARIAAHDSKANSAAERTHSRIVRFEMM